MANPQTTKYDLKKFLETFSEALYTPKSSLHSSQSPEATEPWLKHQNMQLVQRLVKPNLP